jgi:hypothetical protein
MEVQMKKKQPINPNHIFSGLFVAGLLAAVVYLYKEVANTKQEVLNQKKTTDGIEKSYTELTGQFNTKFNKYDGMARDIVSIKNMLSTSRPTTKPADEPIFLRTTQKKPTLDDDEDDEDEEEEEFFRKFQKPN